MLAGLIQRPCLGSLLPGSSESQCLCVFRFLSLLAVKPACVTQHSLQRVCVHKTILTSYDCVASSFLTFGLVELWEKWDYVHSDHGISFSIYIL